MSDKKRTGTVKNPVIHIDNSLKRHKGKVATKEKMDKANETLKKYKLPDAYYAKKDKKA